MKTSGGKITSSKKGAPPSDRRTVKSEKESRGRSSDKSASHDSGVSHDSGPKSREPRDWSNL